jgi:glutamine---fructose-6-phosphate transaminase (isomerizing)
MLKEIWEQPRAITDTTLGRVSLDSGKVFLGEMEIPDEELARASSINIAACGTSWHAALTGKYMIERLARLPVDVDYASEYRYRDPIRRPQRAGPAHHAVRRNRRHAGRAARDEGAGLEDRGHLQRGGAMVAREAHGAIYTHAGPEIGVASTKAFTAQLTALFLLALKLGQLRGKLDKAQSVALIEELSRIPGQDRGGAAQRTAQCEELAKDFSTARDFLYLGRGIHFPIALEGALKLKEISYIHAEGYPAGEMKHGPNALIDETLPVVVLATRDEPTRRRSCAMRRRSRTFRK